MSGNNTFFIIWILNSMCSEEKKDTIDVAEIDTISDDTRSVNTSEQQLKELQAHYLMLNADFQNYKNRVQRERADWIVNAQLDVLKSLFPLADDFERALNVPVHDQRGPVYEGVSMMQKTLEKIFDQYGIKKIDAVATFDPTLHEAIAQISDPDRVPGSIVSVVEHGYMIKGKVVKPSRVVVAA